MVPSARQRPFPIRRFAPVPRMEQNVVDTRCADATEGSVPNDHRRPPSLRGEGTAPDARAPTHAERCRTLVSGAKSATLCTIAREPAGYPYGSLVTVALDGAGRPLFLLSELAEHTGNLHARAEASVLITEPIGTHDQPLALGRVTLLGPCTRTSSSEQQEVRGTFLEQQPNASYYVDYGDFAFYRLDPVALRYVGGFGRMSWVAAEEYLAAEPDPLAPSAPGILKHMNDDHTDTVLAYAKGLARIVDATSATLTAVDRYGIELAAGTPMGPRATRLAFNAPLATKDEVLAAMVEMGERARMDV
jgi:putative heme iron utilization protein